MGYLDDGSVTTNVKYRTGDPTYLDPKNPTQLGVQVIPLVLDLTFLLGSRVSTGLKREVSGRIIPFSM